VILYITTEVHRSYGFSEKKGSLSRKRPKQKLSGKSCLGKTKAKLFSRTTAGESLCLHCPPLADDAPQRVGVVAPGVSCPPRPANTLTATFHSNCRQLPSLPKRPKVRAETVTEMNVPSRRSANTHQS